MQTSTKERSGNARNGRQAKAKAPKPRKTTAERFWSKVDKTAGFFNCWLWTASKRTDGYGKFRITRDGKSQLVPAHVFALLDGKPLPRGKVVMHSCNNPLCCNPLHLSLGTQKANVNQAIRQGRVTRVKLTRETIREALTLAVDGTSADIIAEKLGRNPTQIRTLFRGQTHVKITGISRNSATGKGRDKQVFRDALAFMDAAEASEKVVTIAAHPKFKRSPEPEAAASLATA